MEVCEYPCTEHDPGSLFSQLGQPHHELAPHMHGALLPLASHSPVEKCEQIVVLDSSRIAMQIASGEIVWPIVPKPKELAPKLEPDVHPFANNMHSELEGTDLALGQMGTPLEKCQVRKRLKSASDDGDVHDGDGTNERQAIMRWKDVWVAQLIHVRGRMQSSFSGPQKQRVDLWQVIKNEMARTCPGFDKDSEACRKKWRRVYKEYRDEKMLHAAGDASQRCKFYDLLEYYMADRADGASEPPATYALSVKDEMAAVKGEAFDGNVAMNGQGPLVERKRGKRVKRFDMVKGSATDSESLCSIVSELVAIGKEMLQTTRQFEQDKHEILYSLRETLHEISGKI